MKAIDKDKFEIFVVDEPNKIIENGIYGIIEKSDIREEHTILRSVWSHRRKITPDGVVYRHRERIDDDSNTQKHGIDYNETYSPVLMWSTLRTLFIIGKTRNWSSRKVNYVQDLPQATLSEDDHIYMHLPRGFLFGDVRNIYDCVLKLRKNLYCLK